MAPKFDVIASGAVTSTVKPEKPQLSKFQVSLPQPCSLKADKEPTDDVIDNPSTDTTGLKLSP